MILFCSLTPYAQLRAISVPKKPLILNGKQKQLEEQNKNCVHKNKLTLDKRLSKFPFNKADKIKIVSFAKPNNFNFTYLLPMKNKLVDYTKLKKIITLDNLQIDSLTDIIFNYGYKGIFHSFKENGCLYKPKNAILFLDKNEKTFAFIELCFECGEYRVSDKKISMGELCTQKYELLKKFFKTSGVLYGTQ